MHQLLSEQIRKIWETNRLSSCFFFQLVDVLWFNTVGKCPWSLINQGLLPNWPVKKSCVLQKSKACSHLAETRTWLSLWCLGYSQKLITYFWNPCISKNPRGITSAAGISCLHTQQKPVLHAVTCLTLIGRHNVCHTFGWQGGLHSQWISVNGVACCNVKELSSELIMSLQCVQGEWVCLWWPTPFVRAHKSQVIQIQKYLHAYSYQDRQGVINDWLLAPS